MIRVLVADDQELLRDGLTAILDAHDDLEVVGAVGDGASAVLAATRLCPDVTLMDLRMPGVDGLEATRRLMTRDEPPTRVVVLTTFDDDDLVVTALRHGASGFLLKDLPRDQLVEAIRAVHAGDLRLSPALLRRLVDRHARGAPDPARRAQLERLTDRELEILTLVSRGMVNSEIANAVFLSESTVKTHVGRLLAKLDARDRVQLVIAAYEGGLVGGTGGRPVV